MRELIPTGKRITSAEASYLIHAGKLISVKVSVGFYMNYPKLHIQDFEFWTFQSALVFLQHASAAVVRTAEDREAM